MNCLLILLIRLEMETQIASSHELTSMELKSSSEHETSKLLTMTQSHENETPALEEIASLSSRGLSSSGAKTETMQQTSASNIYILWSLIAALMMAVTSFLRTIASDTPYESFFVLSFSYLLITGIVLASVKCKLGSKFRLAVYKKEPQV